MDLLHKSTGGSKPPPYNISLSNYNLHIYHQKQEEPARPALHNIYSAKNRWEPGSSSRVLPSSSSSAGTGV